MYKKLVRKIHMLRHTHHRVSVKVALLNEAGNKVLMTTLPWGGVGLPGGHIDNRETPHEALVREMYEELGLKEGQYTDVETSTFFRAGGRIILFHTGRLSEDVKITVDPKEVSEAIWVSYDDLKTGKIPTGTYGNYLEQLLLTGVSNKSS